jgi:hypothetical protein
MGVQVWMLLWVLLHVIYLIPFIMAYSTMAVFVLAFLRKVF